MTFSARGMAQAKHPLVISFDAPPGDITVTRDTVLEFRRDLPESEPKHHYVVTCRDQIRDFGDFVGRVTMHWDPAKELGDYFPLTVWTGNPGPQGTPILHFRVHIVEIPPALFVPFPGSDNVVGSVELNVQSGKRGESPPPVDLYLDGRPLGLTTDVSGKAIWNATAVLPGPHNLQGMARLSNGSTYTMELLPIQVVSPLRVTLYAPGGQLDLSKVNGEIPIRAFLLPDLNVRTVTYLLDGKPIGLRAAVPLDQFYWNPNGLTAGKHRLKLDITDVDNKVLHSLETIFTVLARPISDGLFITELPRPAGIVVPPAADEVSGAVHLVMPETPVQLLQPWTLRVEGSVGQKLRRATFYRDGKALPADPESYLALLWDPRCEQPGDYSFRAEVVGEDGKTLKTPSVTIHIPVRVALGTVPTPVIVTEKAHSVILKAQLLSGFQAKQVDFLVDGKVTASRVKAPFDQMEFDTADVETGPHRLQLQVTDTQGAMYTSQWIAFTVDNAPLIARRTQQTEEDKKSDEMARKALRTNELAKIRRSLTMGALGHGSRRGLIGTIYGLSVITETITDRITGTQTVISITGAIDLITATVSPGSGQVTLLNQAAPDTLGALQTAAEFCKRKVGQMGYTVNWPAINMEVQLGSTLPVSGPSAGAAYAVSLLSAALKRPIDSSVAITGAVGASGEIQPVGGVIFKGNAALSNPRIHTLIVPANWVSQLELDALYKLDPALFTSKRIIYAHNMEEVLRQSLIGYDKRYEQAEAYIQDALRAFLNEEYEKSVLDFTQARNLTPENVTILAWLDVVKAMKNKQ